MSKKHKFHVGKVEDYMEKIGEKYKVSKAAQSMTAIKTDAPYDELIKIIK